jgi:hypothetical protein
MYQSRSASKIDGVDECKIKSMSTRGRRPSARPEGAAMECWIDEVAGVQDRSGAGS